MRPRELIFVIECPSCKREFVVNSFVIATCPHCSTRFKPTKIKVRLLPVSNPSKLEEEE